MRNERFRLLWLLAICVVLPPTQLVAQSEGETPTKEKTGPQIDQGILSGFQLRSIGPALMSGRISDIVVNPQAPNTWYVAAGSGNLWKTTNAGTTWSPIFDNYNSYSIGCVALDPQNPEVVWVGTGEDVGGRHVGFGDGVYVSHDGGKSFKNVGLKQSEHIARIVVHPRDSATIYVAAQGPLWNKGGERGLFRSTDGGQTWKNVLSAGEWTGCTDVVIDSKNPKILYAALHQRHRTVAALLNTGPESGIFKSTDGGETWEQLKAGLPGEDKGKIALAISPQKSNVVYASIEIVDREGGFYRSEDYGASWRKMSDFVSGGTGPHYYQEIWPDPHRFDCLYHANNTLVRTLDGGATWDDVEGRRKHVDNHAIAFHPHDADFVLCGTDGGAYCSRDFAETWQHFPNLPITQFYKVDVDYDQPFYNIIGGTQDNSTQYGPARTREWSGIHSADWIVPIGGDGHDNAIDPNNPDIIFGESQEGYIRRYDRRTGETISVRPAPGEGEEAFRFNWDSPILISPHDSSRLYFGSNHLHRSDDHGESWTTISPDLSRNTNRLGMKMMGRVHGVDAGYDLMAMSQYGNITSVSESPVVEGLIYVGTDDGLIQVTEDGGESWRKVDRLYGVPEMAFVNDIKADRHDPDTVYVCLDNHKSGDFKPYLLRSKDRGRTWESMVANLPDRHLVWRFEQDHIEPKLMFLGTEFGLFVSLDAGENWIKMAGGMPTIPIRDLAIQKREHDLVCATFGRSFYVLDDYSPLRTIASALANAGDTYLFAPRETAWYQPSSVKQVGFMGDDFYTAANPPVGAMFTVYVGKSYETARDKRRASERAAAQAGEDVAVPTFEELAAESAEEAPQLMIEIRDAAGSFVNRVACPSSKGLHRVTWDMKQALPIASSPTMLVAPGTYTAQVIRVTETGIERLGDEVNVDLKAIYEPTLPAASRDEIATFVREAAELTARWRHVNSEFAKMQEELSGREAFIRNQVAEAETLLARVEDLETQMQQLARMLSGDQEKRSRDVLDVPTAGERIGSVLWQAASSLHGPTQTDRQQVELARPGVKTAEESLAELQSNMEELRGEMDAAGLIWNN